MIPYRDLQPAPREPVVAYVGRLDEAKGVPLLMAAWDRYLGLVPRPGAAPGHRRHRAAGP